MYLCIVQHFCFLLLYASYVLFYSIYLCIAQHFVRLVCWLLYGHSLSVTRTSPLLKGSYAVVNPPIKYITQEHQSDDDDDGHYTRGDDDDGQGQACR